MHERCLYKQIQTFFQTFYFLDGVTVASYADDTTPYSVDKTKDLVIKEIEHFSEFLFQRFDFS